MNKYLNILITIIVLSSLISCKKNSAESKKDFQVKGTLTYNNVPLSNATISLNRQINYTSTSDSQGYFEINNIPEGEYTLMAKKTFSNGSFTEFSSEILINDNIILNSLRLPKTVILFEPTNVLSNSMNLFWSSTDANDFREYKLYKHSTSGLDETTGELIHVSTTINDTTFIAESLDPVTTYFYRVYVMNDYGRVGGSNIISTITENQNLIWNGDFELSESLFTWWDDSTGTISIIDSILVSGNHSLFIKSRIDNDPVQYLNIYGELRKDLYDLNAVKLIQGRQYKLSGWIKTSGNCGNEPTDLWGVKASIHIRFTHQYAYAISVGQNTDWTYIDENFYVPAGPYSFPWIALRTVSEETWFDDLKLELID